MKINCFSLYVIITCAFFSSCNEKGASEKNKTEDTIVNSDTIVDLKKIFKDLHIPTDGELSDTFNVDLGGEKIPIYSMEGVRLRKMALQMKLMSGDYGVDIYIDNSKEPKAILLRPSTLEERNMMEEYNQNNGYYSKLVGKDATPFSVTDIHGNKYSLQDLKGKVVVVNFWFVECKPCVEEIPDLNRLVDEYKDKGVVFLAFTNNGMSKLEPFFLNNEFNYTIIPECSKLAEKFGIDAYPAHIVIDKHSKIIFASLAIEGSTITLLKKEIDGALLDFTK